MDVATGVRIVDVADDRLRVGVVRDGERSEDGEDGSGTMPHHGFSSWLGRGEDAGRGGAAPAVSRGRAGGAAGLGLDGEGAAAGSGSSAGGRRRRADGGLED